MLLTGGWFPAFGVGARGGCSTFSPHTSASLHRQAGTSCAELKDLGGWKSRVMVDRYAKFYPNTTTPNGQTTMGIIVAAMRENAVINIHADATSWVQHHE